MSIIRCPECRSPFLVGVAQRSVSLRVRCGRCGGDFSLPGDESHSGSEIEPNTVAPPQSSLSARMLEGELAAPPAQRTPFTWKLASVAVVVLGVLGLACQYLWFNLDRLSQGPDYRPLLARFCAHLPCELPPFVDRARLRILGLEVSEDPQFKDVLRVEWVLHNQAPLAQGYPVLRLEFSRLDGERVAGRDFKPTEYLPVTAPRPLLPAGESVRVSFEVLDPSGGALSYRLWTID